MAYQIIDTNLQESIEQWKAFAAHPANRHKLERILQQIATLEQQLEADRIRLAALGVRW
jgi:hypothetical protein